MRRAGKASGNEKPTGLPNGRATMVHVWSSYASARTQHGEPFDRGVNSVTLFYDGTRWWIMGWMFDGSAG